MSGDSEFPIGDWVDVSGSDEPAVLAGVDVGADLINELIDDGKCAEIIRLDYDGPHDLLWRRGGEYVVAPRSNWRKRLSLPGM